MTGIELAQIAANDLSLHVASAGSGPPVIFCHGFPGLWYSWRHQMGPVAEAGWRAIAIDQRGYGRSDRPLDPALYDADHVMGDVIGLLDALGEEKAVLVGHDFGAQQVCNLAIRHRERVAGVVVMSCPYDFDLAGRGGRGRAPALAEPGADWGGGVRPSVAFARAAESHFLHLHYFQTIGPAERELGAQPREFLKRLFWALSGEGQYEDYRRFPSDGTGYLDILVEAPALPWRWMSEADLDHFVAEFTRCGPGLAFIGGLNSYRAADRNWELGEPYADADIEVPALFLSGAEDIVLRMIAPDALDIMSRRTLDLRGIVLIEGAGHFVQMERPEATNRALLNFLATLR
jgi:pimeloyl-ACP methyl ester carboxylesterase